MSSTADRLLAAGLLAVCLLYCLTPVYSENLFWHLRNGEDILDTGTIRTEDPFTWTMKGHRWIQQEWLAETAFAAAWRLGGAAGLTILKSAVVLGTVALAVSASRRRGGSIPGIVFASVLWLGVSQARWFERPHIFTDLFFSLYLFLLALDPKPAVRWALFLGLQVLWVNTHAGFVMGVFLLSIGPICEALAGRWRRMLPGAVLAAAALAVSGIHPNGFGSLEYLPSFLAQPLFRDSIREWWSPFDPRYGTVRTAAALLLLSLASVLVLARRHGRKPSAADAALLGVLFVSSVFAARNIELLALAAIVVVPAHLPRMNRILPAALLALAAAIPFVTGLPREFGPPRKLGPGMAWEIYPVGLADFLEEHSLYGRVFNTNEISGYLQYRFGARLPLYMDGRCLLYPQDFYAEYLLLAQMPDSSLAALQLAAIENRGIELALYDWPEASGSSAFLLAALPGWAPVYWDGLTVAYARTDLLERLGLVDLSLDSADPLAPEELLERPPYAIPAGRTREMLRACSLGVYEPPRWVACCLLARDGRSEEAAALARASGDPVTRDMLADALSGRPVGDDPPPQIATLAAWIMVRQGRFEDAEAQALSVGDTCLAASVAIAGRGIPGEPAMVYRLPWIPPGVHSDAEAGLLGRGDSLAYAAVCLHVAGLEEQAVLAARKCADTPGSRPWALAVSALVLGCAGFAEEAAALSDSALAQGVTPMTLWMRGLLEESEGRYSQACGFLERALRMSPAAGVIRLDLASCLWNAGDPGGAAAAYIEAAGTGIPLPVSARTRLGWAAVLGLADRAAVRRVLASS